MSAAGSTTPRALVAEIRALAPAAPSVADAVAEIIAAVAAEGDAAVERYTARFDEDPPPPQRVAREELAAALVALDPAVRAGLEVAIANVAEVAWAGTAEDREVALPQGHQVLLRELPVTRAAVYVPGGRAPYPSTVVMGAVTARAAGRRSTSSSRRRRRRPGHARRLRAGRRQRGPPRWAARRRSPRSRSAPRRVARGRRDRRPRQPLRAGGQAPALRPRRHRRLRRPERPGRALRRRATPGSIRLIALDLLAQAEHGEASLVVAVAADAPRCSTRSRPTCARCGASSARRACSSRPPRSTTALAFCDAFAPEHLELIGPGAEQLARDVRRAGCLFVGWPSATAFGDYVAGSNHILPTGGLGALRLGARHAHLPPARWPRCASTTPSLLRLVLAGVPIARAEGFSAHAARCRPACRTSWTIQRQ